MSCIDKPLAYFRQIIHEIEVGERAYRPTCADIGVRFGFSRQWATFIFDRLDEEEKKIWRATLIRFCFNESDGKFLAEMVTDNLERFFNGQHDSVLTRGRIAEIYKIIPKHEDEISKILEKYMEKKDFQMWLFLIKGRKPETLQLAKKLYQISRREVVSHRETGTPVTHNAGLARRLGVYESCIGRMFKALALCSDIIAERQRILEEQDHGGGKRVPGLKEKFAALVKEKLAMHEAKEIVVLPFQYELSEILEVSPQTIYNLFSQKTDDTELEKVKDEYRRIRRDQWRVKFQEGQKAYHAAKKNGQQ